MFGEEVYLDRDQSDDCRLFGCTEPGTEIVFVREFGIVKARFCKRHAYQVGERELLLTGIAGLPRSK